MFIDNFKNICALKGISMSRVLLDLEMGKSNITKWRSGIEPSNSTKKKIADYLEITVDELMSGEIKKPAAQGDELSDEEWEFLKLYRSYDQAERDALRTILIKKQQP